MAEECKLDVCERLFVKLSLYWRSVLIGFLALVSLGSGVWTWSWAEVKQSQSAQDERIHELEAGLNDISFIRSQANEILDNQRVIIKYLEKKR